jgi:heme/copper-type cytochrome/quinol oxidase subunit 3
MKEEIGRDVSKLPTFGFDAKSTPWWGTMAFIALEGMGFAIAVGAYLYLLTNNPRWPLNSPPPVLWPSTVMTLLLLLSVVPSVWSGRVARDFNLRRVRIGLVVMSVVGVMALVVRAFEFAFLNVRWDRDAYGSIVWVVLGLHTTHLATDVGDTIVLCVLMFTKHAAPRRFSDVTDNAFYWNFVVLAWLPLYALLYWIPRL